MLARDLEDAMDVGDEAAIERTKSELQSLNRKVYSLGNLAFLMPETNQSISNRMPKDYLDEIAKSEVGRKSLEAQLIPLDPQLWKHISFDKFCTMRCELLAEKAKELFFSP
jgi:hypothetical protein